MSEQPLRPCLSPLTFSSTNQLRLYQNGSNEGHHGSSNQALLSVDEIRQRGLQYKHLFCDSVKRKKAEPSVFLLLGGGNGKQRPFSITRELFTQLLDTCRLPRAFIQSINCNNGSLGHFIDYTGKKSNCKPSSLSIVIETPYTPFHDFSAAMRFDIQNGNLIGMLFSKKEQYIPQVIQRFEHHRKESLNSPLRILALLYEEYGSNAEDWRKKLDREVVRIEQTTGMTSLALTDHAWEEMEYEKLVRDLHACNTNLIFLGDLIHFEINFGEFCYKLFDIFEDLRKSAGKSAFHTPQTKDEIHNGLAFLLKLSRFRQQQTQALRQRIQSQTNLLYSLISQRDSRVNFIIAEESRGIALAAQQDSRTMRTIGFLTLVFLPCSLVASVFSSGIFDLSNQKTDGSDTIVAPLWWIFALTSLTLTSVVILVWWIWNKRALRTGTITSEKGPKIV